MLLRNVEALSAAGEALWFNPPATAGWRDLDPGREWLQAFSQDRADWRTLAQAGADIEFGDFPREMADLPTIILTLPREKQRLAMLAHLAADLLARDGRLFLVGEIRAGIKSSPRHLESCFGEVTKRDFARHCALIEARQPRPPAPFEADDYCQHWRLQHGALDLQVASWPGVFAHGSLDEGTRLLLANLPDLAPGAAVLDFGCGAGIIGAALLARDPSLRCTLVDNNALACRSARATLEANGQHATVLASDGFSEVAGRFDLVISNPPFHIRHRSVISLSPALLGPVRNFLHPGGQFLLVANRHLPYARWLDESFGRHERLAGDRRFQVLSARN